MLKVKINLQKFRRTNLGFPSEWKGCGEDGNDIVLTFRYGVLKILDSGGQILLSTSKDLFDIGGYLSDEDLVSLLSKEGVLVDDE